MKMNSLAGLTTGIFMLGIAGMANATILTFDDLEEAGTDSGFKTQYIDQGFQITSSSGNFSYWHQSNSNYNTSAALFQNSDNGIVRLSAIDGSLFNLMSIDLDTVYANNGPSPVTFQAYNSANQLVATEGLMLTTDGWATFNFTSAFSGLSYVEWTQEANYHQVDNIAILDMVGSSPIPEPATMVLFGTGLAAFAGSRARKTKK